MREVGFILFFLFLLLLLLLLLFFFFFFIVFFYFFPLIYRFITFELCTSKINVIDA